MASYFKSLKIFVANKKGHLADLVVRQWPSISNS